MKRSMAAFLMLALAAPRGVYGRQQPAGEWQQGRERARFIVLRSILFTTNWSGNGIKAAGPRIFRLFQVTLFAVEWSSCMLNWVYKSALIIVVVCVLVVFLAPTIDLPETALRAQQNAQNVIICITLLMVQFLFAIVLILFRLEREDSISRFSANTNPLLCTFLC